MARRDYEISDEILDAADRFVALANELGENASRDWVRAGVMYVAARCNAFTWITRDDDSGQTVDHAAAYFRNEYESMSRENLKEVEPVYRAAQRGNPR